MATGNQICQQFGDFLIRKSEHLDNEIIRILRPTDQLFVFVTDHGNHTPGGAERDSELNLWNNEVFRDADLVLITKCDLAAAVGFDRNQALAAIRQTAPKAQILEVSAKTGAGLDAWYAWLSG